MNLQTLLKKYWSLAIIFIFCVVAASVSLSTLPGLMGDEASEGENVYLLLHGESSVWQGERSYIGPLADWIRIPFIVAFGYSTIALRLPMLLATIALFFVAAVVTKKLFGEQAALFVLASVTLSPIYLTQQRLGWAITYLPLLALLLIWIATSSTRYKALLYGFVAGLGVHIHILFLPTAVAITTVSLIDLSITKENGKFEIRKKFKKILGYWPALIGFWAAFSTQLIQLMSFKEDQGEPVSVAALFIERLHDLPKLLPAIISGSSYIASYSGRELSSLAQWLVAVVIVLLAVAAVVLSTRKKMIVLWTIGLLVHVAVLLVMIDRFSLRYFVIFTLGLWVLAAIGISELVKRFAPNQTKIASIALALIMLLGGAMTIAVPYWRTGGSTDSFSLGNRTDSASALVDIRPLLECTKNKKPLMAESVHIYNRLQYLSHDNSDIKILGEEQQTKAKYAVKYRLPGETGKQELCPDLTNFIVEPYRAPKADNQDK